ncbi:DUF5110 domain-containing protein [Rhodohalobacter sp. SW132]|uniref:glycoside hydrolase family 31 protein n=1 Tax=Rhodohalobacter sp. SW132 TaxID=2293433 RepID=UPI000E249AEB|nr:DUF5110 domain-containing protein [Rhodohalobacter sp. SW132]REL33344.1 DUF5110 domain-containing protein [Rhodohalobacter sp. SW132]
MRILVSSLHYLLAFLLISLLSSCSPYPQADFYEVDGIISIVPESGSQYLNWQEQFHVNSRGLIYQPEEPDSAQSLRFSVYVTNPGNYSLHILATGYGTLQDQGGGPDITITGPDNFLVDRFTVSLPQDEVRLQWIPRRDGNSSSDLNFSNPGLYEIRLHPRDLEGLQVHKIHLSHSDYVKPTGTGLPPSISPEINSADLFREQTVMLPPDWYFGFMTGYAGMDFTPDAVNTHLGTSTTLPDAAWFQNHDFNSDLSSIRQNWDEVVYGKKLSSDEFPTNASNGGLSEIFNRGYQYLLLDGPVELSDLSTLHELEQSANPERERNLYLRHHFVVNDSHHLQYPAPVSKPTTFSWDSAPEIDQNGYYSPGGLSQLLESVSDPTLSSYNTPFISYPVSLKGRADEELFLRTIQLSAFLPSMHFLVDDFSHDSFTESEIEMIRESTDLRSRLFPYIYTHAHITRQTRNSLIGGFRDYPGQFRFGDAFLVAPVSDPGVRERSVYFPDDGFWYDYYSGREYRAGQSWVVEAPLRHIPLFVKAGSIISYRPEGGPIRDGNNDHLQVEIYTGNAGTFRLTEDDGFTRDYRRAIAARTMFRYNEVAGQLRLTIGAVQREYSGMNEYRSYELRFMHTSYPESVELNGELMTESHEVDEQETAWFYDRESSILILNLPDRWKHERTEIAITP